MAPSQLVPCLSKPEPPGHHCVPCLLLTVLKLNVAAIATVIYTIILTLLLEVLVEVLLTIILNHHCQGHGDHLLLRSSRSLDVTAELW